MAVFQSGAFHFWGIFLRQALFFTLLGCLFAGCNTEKKNNQKPNLWNGPQKLEINTPYFIRTITRNAMDALDEENPTTRYAAVARYPEYVGSQFQPLNEEILNYVESKIDDFADVMLTASYNQSFPADSFSEMSIDFIPFHYTSGFVSLFFKGYERTPAWKNGFNYYYTINYDALNNKMLSISDCLMLSEENFPRLADKIAQKLIQEHPKWKAEDICAGTDPTQPENFEIFILRPGEFIIHFPPYQLGMRQREHTSVTIPFSETEIQPYILDLINFHPQFEINMPAN